MRDYAIMKFFGSRREEGGYTLQTMVIVAVLTAGAVLTLVVLYGILGDSSDVIGGGAQSADGLPGEPRNVVVRVAPGESDGMVNLEMSWEVPEFLGEYALVGYEPLVLRTDMPDEDPQEPMCDHGLSVLKAEGFSGGNHCELAVDKDGTYMFELGLVLGRAQGGENRKVAYIYPVGIAEPQRIAQGEAGNLQVLAGREAMVVRWPGGSLAQGGTAADMVTAYRFRVTSGAGSYVLCVPSRHVLPPGVSRSDTQELVQLPYLTATAVTQAGGGGRVSNGWPLIIHQSGPETYPEPGVVHEIELSVSTVSISDMNGVYTLTQEEQFCLEDMNFLAREAVIFQGSYGVPEVPRFTVESVESVQVGEPVRPQVRVTSYPCVDTFPNDDREHQNAAGGALFTFYWTEAHQPTQPDEVSFSDCRRTLPVTAPDDGSAVLIWARATNTAGGRHSARLVSGDSAPVLWSPQPTPPPPASLQASWSAVGIEPDDYTQVDFFWQASPVTAAGVTLPATHYAYTIATGDTLCSSETALPSGASSGVVPAHRTRTPSQNVPNTANGIACVEVRALAGDRASAPVRLVTSPPQVKLSPQDDAQIILATWRVSQLDNTTHFTAELSLDANCNDPGQVLLADHLPATGIREANGAFTTSLPLTRLFDRDGMVFGFESHVCLTEHYTNNTRHTFYKTRPEPPKTPPGINIDTTVGHHAGTLDITITPTGGASLVTLDEFFICLYTETDSTSDTPFVVTAVSSKSLIDPDDNTQILEYKYPIISTGLYTVRIWTATTRACIYSHDNLEKTETGQAIPLPALNNLSLERNGNHLQANAALADPIMNAPYDMLGQTYLCFDLNRPDGNDNWQNQPGGTRRAEISTSFSNASFTFTAPNSWDFTQQVTQSASLLAGNYQLRAWASRAAACPYPDSPSDYQTTSLTITPAVNTAVLTIKGSQAELSAALEATAENTFLCVALDQPAPKADLAATATAFSSLTFVNNSFTLPIDIGADVPSGDYTATIWTTLDNSCPDAAGSALTATTTVGPHITSLTLSDNDATDTVSGTITLDDSQITNYPDYNDLPYKLCYELTGPPADRGGASASPEQRNLPLDGDAITIAATRTFSYTFSNDLPATGQGNYTVKAWTAHKTDQACQHGLNDYAATQTVTGLTLGRPTVQSLSFSSTGLTLSVTGALTSIPSGLSYSGLGGYLCFELNRPDRNPPNIDNWQALPSFAWSSSGLISPNGQFQSIFEQRNTHLVDTLPLGQYQVRAWTADSDTCPGNDTATVATAEIGNLEVAQSGVTLIIEQKTPQVTVTLTPQFAASDYSTLSYYLCTTLQPPGDGLVGGTPVSFADLTVSQDTRQATYSLDNLDVVPSGNYEATVWTTTENSCATQPSHRKADDYFVGPHVETLTVASDFAAQTITATIIFDNSLSGERYGTLPYKLCYELTDPSNTKTTGEARFNALSISDTRQGTHTLRNITAAGSYTLKAWTASAIPAQTCANGDRGEPLTKTATINHN